MICIRCSEHEGNTGNGLCQRCNREVAGGEEVVTGTPRTDAACDYTAPEKLHRLCKTMEGELAAARREVEQTHREYDHLLDECVLLRQWKDSQLQIESEWNPQEIAKLVGATLGQSCRKVIQKKVPEIVAELAAVREQHKDAYWAYTENEKIIASLRAELASEKAMPDQLLDVHAICDQRDAAVSENNRLRDIIRRASAKFCEDGPGGEIAAAMLEILREAQ